MFSTRLLLDQSDIQVDVRIQAVEYAYYNSTYNDMYMSTSCIMFISVSVSSLPFYMPLCLHLSCLLFHSIPSMCTGSEFIYEFLGIQSCLGYWYKYLFLVVCSVIQCIVHGYRVCVCVDMLECMSHALSHSLRTSLHDSASRTSSSCYSFFLPIIWPVSLIPQYGIHPRLGLPICYSVYTLSILYISPYYRWTCRRILECISYEFP